MAIVIPAYKETFLRQTLESIANQTDKRFHLYVGDDCSPYDLESIVNEFEDRIALTYKRFDTNLGGKDLVAQWERCIAMSEEEPYIWLFSDDDIMGENCVEQFYKSLPAHPDYDVFHYDVDVIDKEGKVIRKVRYPSEISSRELYRSKIKGSLECFVVEYIFSRKIYEKSGGFVRFDLAWGSDLATWVKFGQDKGIYTIPGAVVYWRSSGENISTNEKPEILQRKTLALVECLKWGESLYPDALTRKINEKGLVSRLSMMSVHSTPKIGLSGIGSYADSFAKKMELLFRYCIHYAYKKAKDVF